MILNKLGHTINYQFEINFLLKFKVGYPPVQLKSIIICFTVLVVYPTFRRPYAVTVAKVENFSLSMNFAEDAAYVMIGLFQILHRRATGSVTVEHAGPIMMSML